MKPVRAAVAALVLPLLSLTGPAPSADAVGAVRWASPGGTGTACTEAAPCDLDTAVEAAEVNPGDEVIVTPGSYSIGELFVDKAIDLHGEAGQPAPTITTTSTFGVLITAAATVSHLDLVASGTSSGLSVVGSVGASGATIERITSRTSLGGGTACQLARAVLLRDSVCWATGTNSRGVGAILSPGSGTLALKLRNVTAVGETNGLVFESPDTGTVVEVDAKNVIAYANADGETDVRALATGGGTVHITLASSSYATEQHDVGAGGGTATVTAAGSGTNQTAAPVFVDAAAGDFHQAAGSPTLDAGELDASTGAADLDGDPRAIRATSACPARPDIGADERTSTLECDPPETTLTGPSGATEDSTPTFQVSSDDAGSTFECRVDAATFTACGSPFTTAVLAPGQHSVEARATDPSGNVDPTPAARSLVVTVAAPETTITQAPKRRIRTAKRKVRVQVSFVASSPGTFECSLDGAAFRACTSPYRARVGIGRHRFLVRAVDTYGTADQTPAAAVFRVRRRR